MSKLWSVLEIHDITAYLQPPGHVDSETVAPLPCFEKLVHHNVFKIKMFLRPVLQLTKSKDFSVLYELGKGNVQSISTMKYELEASGPAYDVSRNGLVCTENRIFQQSANDFEPRRMMLRRT